jgi:uncharacterized integral membrane protein
MIGNIVAGILVALVLIFVFQNTKIVEVEFLAWKVSTSRALVLLVTFLIGAVSGLLSQGIGKKR